MLQLPANDLTGQPHYQPVPAPPSQVDNLSWPALPDPDEFVRIHVLDSGVNRQQQWLQQRHWGDSEPDQVDTDEDGRRDDAAGHGTFVAGIITRLASYATVRVLDVLDGRGWVSEEAVAHRIDELPAANILNLSFGGFTYRNRPPELLKRAILHWLDRNPGSVVVAAAGNTSVGRRFWPAAMRRVIAVAAVDRLARPADFTNYGTDDDRWVDACALADNVQSTFITFPPDAAPRDDAFHGWANWSGTSFAAPVVVAAIARRMQASGYTITPEQAWRQLSAGKPSIVHDGKYVGTLID
ncbi:MAG TPA: S8 family serine peptidase [Nitriliruptorales bacterium]|nr:S8 family serine peptidase [Nitriliruptorales bacterium]